MNKIKVTAQQRANAIEARDVMWPSVPPENVAKGLEYWSNSVRPTARPTCGTHACFGGWVAWWPEFRRQGVRPDPAGAPTLPESVGRAVSFRLFGSGDLFRMRGCPACDRGFNGTDHELVTHRLNWLIANSEVA